MKYQNKKESIMKTFKVISMVMALVVAMAVAVQAQADTNWSEYGGSSAGECKVRRSSGNGSASLWQIIQTFNYTTSPRICDKKITFAVSDTIKVNRTLAINNRNDTNGLLIGGEKVVTIKSELAEDEPVFLIQNTDNVEIKNIKLTGNASTFVRCESTDNSPVTTLKLTGIEVANNAGNAIYIDGCNNVTISGLQVKGSSGNSDAVVQVYNSAGVTISGGQGSGEIKDIKGTFLRVERAGGVTVHVKVTVLNSGWVASFDSVLLNSIDIVGNIVENGVAFDNVDGSGPITLKLLGNQSETTAGIGLKLNLNAKNMEFSGSTKITNFGGDGVQIWNSSNQNHFYGVTIKDNLGNGFVIKEQALGIEVRDSFITHNRGCGIVLESENSMALSGTQLNNNGESGCPIKVGNSSPVVELLPTDVILTPVRNGMMILDVASQWEGSGGSNIATIELHRMTRWKSSNTGTTTGGTESTGTSNAAGVTRVVSGIVAGDLPSSDTSDSLIDEYPVGTTAFVDGRNVSDFYFAILRSDGGEIEGYWSGRPLSTLGDENCYLDETTNTLYRVYQPTLDTDGDDLLDYQEDANMNCREEPGETHPNKFDTDEDGISDSVEIRTSKTDPQKEDDDGDGLEDGEEVGADGVWDKDIGETNPKASDSDGDGLSDSYEKSLGLNPNNNDTDIDGLKDADDLCPRLHKDQGVCYYNNCALELPIPADQDTDLDGISDVKEDSNHNCLRDASETDVQSQDTDGDGIDDGVEDYDRNGLYEPEKGESNPNKTDSDGDCITDGKEDKIIADGYYDFGAGETSPVDTDSDDDGLADGIEDKNCNGTRDPDETDPGLSDSEGDGQDDNVDLCPWSTKPGCVVYYCEVSGFDRDTDSDGINDKDEDSDGDCLHTVQKKESSPLLKDTDGEGLDDGLEACYETNPNVKDTDGDGRSDFDEVEDSGNTCTAMYNLGSTNPLRAEYGSCSLNRGDATSGALLTIILMTMAVIPVVVIRRKKEMDQ